METGLRNDKAGGAPAGWRFESRYIVVRDQTRLAARIYRPTRGGIPESRALPVVWAHDRYHRATLSEEGRQRWLDKLPWFRKLFGGAAAGAAGLKQEYLDSHPWLKTILEKGYIVAFVEVRGSGASFGTRQGPLDPVEAEDAYDVTEWFSEQPWCDGAIGMFGRSYLGLSQYFAASASPPHLRAIFPEMALFDLYSFVYSGGIYRHDFAQQWTREVQRLDQDDLAEAVADEEELSRAVQEHRDNRDPNLMFAALPFRDSTDPETGEQPFAWRNPARLVEAIGDSGVAAYHLAGWFDLWPKDALLWYRNLKNPQKLIIGPWAHTGSFGLNMAAEHLRWYDYWLKGESTGVLEDSPIHYYTVDAPLGTAWRGTDRWPVPEAVPTPYFMNEGRSGSVESVNDGVLARQDGGEGEGGEDRCEVDYTATSGDTSRWANGYGGPYGYSDLSDNDAKGLTYTTEPLEEPLEITGHPIVHLWLSCSAPDCDVFVYLEDVRPDGFSDYVTEGALRASHRALGEAPFDYLGLPYHSGNEEDCAPLPVDEVVELVLDLHPIAKHFAAGHRIRVSITFADVDNALTPVVEPSPRVTIHRGAAFPSRMILPCVPVPLLPQEGKR